MMDWRHQKNFTIAGADWPRHVAMMLLPANWNAVMVFAFSLLLCLALLVAQCCGEHRASPKQRSGSSVTLSGIDVYIGRMNLTL